MAEQHRVDERLPIRPVAASSLARLYVENERLMIGGTTIVAFFAIWEAVVLAGIVDPSFISSPSRIVAAGYEVFATGEIWADLKVSGIEFVTGYLLAAAVAIPLGLAIGWYKRLYYLLGPFIETLNAVPRVTLLPLIIIWFGIGMWSTTVVVFLGAVIPMLISIYSGVKTNEARFLKVARSFCASEFKIFTSIVLPGTVPFIFTGLKYASGRALLGVVVGELYAASAGIGYFIGFSGNTFQTDRLFVGVIIVMFTGVVTVAALNHLERRFDKWRPDVGAGR